MDHLLARAEFPAVSCHELTKFALAQPRGMP